MVLDFTIQEWIIIVIGILSIFPTIILFKQFYQTHIIDFLLFGIMYFFVSIAAIFQFLTKSSNSLFQYQIVHWSVNIVFLMIFIHSSLLIWEHRPKLLWVIGLSWFTVLMVIILFWEVYELPEKSFVIFTEMTSNQTNTNRRGAGLIISGNVTIYSTGFAFLTDSFRIFGACLLLYAYFKVEPIFPTQRIILALKAWRFATILLFIWSIIRLSQQFGLPQTQFDNVLIVSLQIIIVYLSIRIPEGMLISKAQIMRATYLYKIVDETYSKNIPLKQNLPSIIEYVKSLPIELLHENNQ